MLNDDLRQLLLTKTRLFVGLSGGLDSCALLHILTQDNNLKTKITAIHVNHGLSKNSDSWQNSCELFCKTLNIPIIIKKLNLTSSSNQEEVARIKRYQAFGEHVSSADVLLLGHHEQDQAETFLLNLLRGSGIDGLSSMHHIRELFGFLIVRPLLKTAKKDLEHYALINKLKYIEDESNLLEKHSRNYIRHKILPALQKKWPSAIRQLALATEDMQRAQANLFDLACMDYPLLINKVNYIDLSDFKESRYIPKLLENTYNVVASSKAAKQSSGSARLENVIWHWLKIHNVEPLNTKMIERVIEDLIFNKNKDYRKVLFGQHEVIKYKNKLYILSVLEYSSAEFGRMSNENCNWHNFPDSLILPNQIGVLQATVSDKGAVFPKNARIEVRFNEKNAKIFWHKQTKTLKKLWQTWGIPIWQRASIPLIYVDDELAVIVGYAIGDKFYSSSANVQKFNFSYKR